MTITGTDIKYNRPPLPFVGNKRLFLTPFCEVIKRFQGQTVFDAFGGSGLLSRFAKDTRPDLDVTLNDISDYSWRLSCVKDTNEILQKLREAGAYRSNDSYDQYPQDIEARIKEIVSQAKDKESAMSSVFVKGSNTVRALCRTVDFDEDLCKHWYDGLNKKRINLGHYNGVMGAYDLYILDPPYKTKAAKTTRTRKEYAGSAIGAFDFCVNCIMSGQKIILFDEIDSYLIKLFRASYPDYKEYIPTASRKGRFAKDMMIYNF